MAFSDIDDPDRLAVEQWVGPVAAGDYGTYETLITAYGSPYAAALHQLRRRLAQLVVTPTDVASGSDRVSHQRNIAALERLIADLVSYMNENIEDLGLTDEGEELLEGASTGPTEETIAVDTVANNRRRG